MTCKWNGSGNPRTVPGRHDGACQDEACPGCAILRRILGRRSIEDRGYSTPCWISTYHKDEHGYAKIKLRPDPINRAVHRVAYELLVGPVPAGTRSRKEGGRECRPCNTNRKRSVRQEEGAA